MPFAVLKNWHPMCGVDFHIPWVPGTPAPAPSPVPYKTMYVLNGLGFQCAKADDHLSCNWGLSMLKGTDIGTMIPHVGPPSLTLPIEMLASASKSHFGTSRYKSKGTPVAAALLVVVNPNLNCGTPVPAPLGFVVAITTHFVDMSLADIIAGLVSMAVDFAIQSLLNWAGGKVGSAIGKALGGVFAPCFALTGAYRALGATGEAAFDHYAAFFARRAAGEVVGAVASTAFGFFFGGPLGADIGTFGGYGKDADGNAITPGGSGASAVSNAAEGAAHSVFDGPEVNQPAQPLPGSPGTDVK